MDTKYLSYVIAIAEEKNLHKAAEKLFLSQPSLSQFLSKLEADIGTPLFIRSRKGLQLTEAGKLYVEAARDMIQAKNSLYRNINRLIYQNHLSIASTSQWGINTIEHAIPEYKKIYPDVILEVTESFFPSMTKRLQNHEVDICLASVLNPGEGYESLLINEEEIFLILPERYQLTDSSVLSSEEIKQLEEVPFLLTSQGSTTQTLVSKYFETIHFHPTIYGYFDNIKTISSLVAKGCGASFIPELCINSQLKGVKYYRITPSMKRKHIIAWQKEIQPAESVQLLLELLQNKYRELYSQKTVDNLNFMC